MNTKLSHFLWVTTCFFFAGCISDFNAKLPYTDENILVVEGDIISNTESQIILSKTFSLDETELPGDYNNVQAVIYLVGSDGYKSSPANYLGNGVHSLSVGELHRGVSYSIEINYDGELYASEPEKPIVTPEIDDLNWSQPYRAADVSIHVSTHSDEPGYSYYIWDYVEDWEIFSSHEVRHFYNPVTQVIDEYDWFPVYYCWKTAQGKDILIGSTESYTENKILNQQLVVLGSNEEKLSYLYSIRLRQMALSKRAYEYYQNKLKLSEDMGGIFSPQPSDLAGNVKCTSDKSRRVIGYINMIHNVTETQLFINSNDITKDSSRSDCYYYSISEIYEMMAEMEMQELYQIYNIGYWPIIGEDQKGLEKVPTWMEADCIDCTRRGGTKNKPSFWPNNHK